MSRCRAIEASTYESGTWSSLSWIAFPLRQRITRASPALAATSFLPPPLPCWSSQSHIGRSQYRRNMMQVIQPCTNFRLPASLCALDRTSCSSTTAAVAPHLEPPRPRSPMAPHMPPLGASTCPHVLLRSGSNASRSPMFCGKALMAESTSTLPFNRNPQT